MAASAPYMVMPRQAAVGMGPGIPPLARVVSSHDEQAFPLSVFPRSETMEVVNDPRFMANSIVAKRLAAFQTICVVAILMVNLSVKQMFALEKTIDIHTAEGVMQYVGFVLMTMVFLMNLLAVIVLIQQLFMTYRLLTAGPTGFETAASFYVNPNIVKMRHMAAKAFFFSLPLFVVSSSCMVWVSFARAGTAHLAMPVVAILALSSLGLCMVNMKHSAIFKERYTIAKVHEEPLISHVEGFSHRSNFGGNWFSNLDV